jgi:hypothetical protein
MSPELRRDWLSGDIPGTEPGTVIRMQICLPEIKTELMKEDRFRDGGNDILTRRLANIMNNTKGWRKMKRRLRVKNYGPQWVYKRTDADRTRLELSLGQTPEYWDVLS